MGASHQVGGASRLHYIRMNRTVRDAVRLLASPEIDALVVIDGNRVEDGTIIGILTERDVVRAMMKGGLDVLDGLVWMLVKTEFVSVDAALPQAGRLEQFCAHRTEHLAVMDGFSLHAIQSVWDCLAESPARPAAAVA